MSLSYIWETQAIFSLDKEEFVYSLYRGQETLFYTERTNLSIEESMVAALVVAMEMVDAMATVVAMVFVPLPYR